MPIPFFRCDRCRREYDTLEEAQCCEDSHLTVLSAIEKDYSVWPYPHSLEVTLSDGKKYIYAYDGQEWSG